MWSASATKFIYAQKSIRAIEWTTKIKHSIDWWLKVFSILIFKKIFSGRLVHRNEFRRLCWAGKLSSAWCLRGLCIFFFGKCSLFVVISLVSGNYFVIDSGFMIYISKRRRKNWDANVACEFFLAAVFIRSKVVSVSCDSMRCPCVCDVVVVYLRQIPVKYENIAYIFRLLVFAKYVKISACKWRSLECGKHTKNTHIRSSILAFLLLGYCRRRRRRCCDYLSSAREIFQCMWL